LKISVASGKGGTGKTTFAVNLALSLDNVRLYDCDVEEPNVHTLLAMENIQSELVYQPIPVVDQAKCTLCGACADFCQFNAIFVGKSKVVVYGEVCHSCGGCAVVCPTGAIREAQKEVGYLYTGKANGIHITYGELKIGEPMAIPVIKAVKSKITNTAVSIIDAPPGTSCPVIETIRESDYVVLVTEPTPFGVHDLMMALDVVEEIGVPHGVVVNRAGIGDDSLLGQLEERGVPVLMEIPFDRRIAELYSRGIPFVKELTEYQIKFKHVFEKIEEAVSSGK
jgi:MinD superfamily P-loop ATPase